MLTHVRIFLLLTIASVLFVACDTEKGPAELAIKAAEQAVTAAKGEAAKYVPDQLKSVEAALTSVKEQFAKGDYKATLAGAQDLATKTKDLLSAASAKKDELTKSWGEMSGGVEGMTTALKSRVDMLSSSKKLPANLTADTLASAKTGLATITQEWTAASEAFKSGNLADAVAKATGVKTKAAEIMTSLGMTVPSAAKS